MGEGESGLRVGSSDYDYYFILKGEPGFRCHTGNLPDEPGRGGRYVPLSAGTRSIGRGFRLRGESHRLATEYRFSAV